MARDPERDEPDRDEDDRDEDDLAVDLRVVEDPAFLRFDVLDLADDEPEARFFGVVLRVLE